MLREQIYFPIPEAVFGAGLAFGEPTWYAIHTMARHEKRVTTNLQEDRICAFLPLVEQLHRWSDRRSRVEVPLFSCYVFVRIVPTTDNRVHTHGIQFHAVANPTGTFRRNYCCAASDDIAV